MTSIVNHYTGSDRDFHLVILDNGRSRVLGDARRRELLHCIRCGACLNVCPVYQTVGGGPYGWVYPGPIGIALAPWQRGPGQAQASGASSLCGACTSICPVRIDLAGHIVAGRAAPGQPVGAVRRLAFALFAVVMASPALYALAARLLRFAGRLGLDRLGPAGWIRHREMPRFARRFFHERGGGSR
jgi:L-lactate dehydrogenase complex protein LldF